MSVSIVFTVDNVATTSINHSTVEAGNETTAKTVYVSLSGANNPVNNFRLYLDAKSGTYSGSKTAAEDKTEIIGWGDGNTAAAFGGVQFNFLKTSDPSFPSSGWGTYDSKSPTGGTTIRTGVGDSLANAILLSTTAGLLVSTAGHIPKDVTTSDIAFQMRIKVPSSVATLGTRQFDIKAAFSYTS